MIFLSSILCLATITLAPGKSSVTSFPVTPDTWYHVSARIGNQDIDHSSAVALRYYDAQGKVIKTESGVSCWRKDLPLTRFHRVVKTPVGAVRCDAIAANHGKRGLSEFDEIRLDASLADCRDETAGTIVLNGSFEEADLEQDFIDVWVAPKGGVCRSRDARHGFHALALSDGAVLAYGASGARSLAVDRCGRLQGHLAAKGGGSVELSLLMDDGTRFARTIQGGGTVWREEDFVLEVPQSAHTASLELKAKGSVLIDALYLGVSPFGGKSLGAAVPQDEEIAVSSVPIPRSSVKSFQGIPTWFVGDMPIVDSLYTCRVKPGSAAHWLNYHKKVIEAGQFPIFVIGDHVNADDIGPESLEDFMALIDFQIRFIMSVRPDARFLVWYQQYPTKAFSKAYPDELGQVEDPDQGWAHRIPGYSYGSEIWSRLCERSVRKFFKACFERPYGDRIVGFMPGFGNFGENNYGQLDGVNYLSLHDFSPAMSNFFRKWLVRAYAGDVAAFGKAWNRPGFNFAHAQVPTTLQRVPPMEGAFLSAKLQRQTIDYARCESFAILHRVDRMCRAAKEITGGRVFTASEIGYLSARHGHREMVPILESRWLDAFGPAPGYMNRGPGDDIPAFAPVASLMHHNKVYLYQSDVRSHKFGHPLKRFGETDGAEESAAVYLREIGKYMVQGLVPYHWTFDQWYSDPKIMEVVGNFDRYMRLSGKFPRQQTAEIAVVLDPLSLSAGIEYNYSRQPSTAAAHFMFNTRLEWHRLGAPYDLWLLDDLLASAELSRYRVVVFPAQVALTVQQRRLIKERLCRDGRTLVWMFAPGVFKADGTQIDYSPDSAAVTGFTLQERKGNVRLVMKPDVAALKRELDFVGDGAEFGWSRTGLYGGFSYPWDHTNPKVWPPEVMGARFSVTRGGTVLARYADDGSPAMAIRREDDHTSCFWGSTVLNREILAAIARKAGVHLYTDRPAVVYANRQFGMVHVKEGGALTVKLPQKVAAIIDVVSGRTLAANTDALTYDFQPKSTLLFYFGDPAAYAAAQTAVDAEMAACRTRNEALRPQYAFEAVKTNLAVKAELGVAYEVDRAGFIRDWLYLGPFPSKNFEGYGIDYLGGEAQAVPRSGDAVGKHRWVPWRLSCGFVKAISNEFPVPQRNDLVYYLSCRVVSPDEREALLAVGSDDGEKTWLNGQLATAKDGRSRSCVPDSEMVPVRLSKGENLLVVKITQGGGGNGHAIRFLAPGDEKPMTDLKVVLR
ncbi:MAG: hypothetical protein MJ240_06300 [Kiritimatiellae bacterium]|nr:hypothetical protein [Kiritimatiellia bacterium]